MDINNKNVFLPLVFCKFTDGDVIGGKEELMGTTTDEVECAHLVHQERPHATGATYSETDQHCWAESGTSIQRSNLYRACIMHGKIWSF